MLTGSSVVHHQRERAIAVIERAEAFGMPTMRMELTPSGL
jgi:hypothetical protein